MDSNNRRYIDQFGLITSGLCALHCAAIPILLAFGLIGGVNGVMHDTIETGVIILSSCLGLLSIYNGLSGHGRLIPQVMIGSGALFIIGGLLVPFLGHGFMAIGGCMLAFGHWNNWKLLTIKD